MEEVQRDGEWITVTATLDELRLILGAVNESLNGAYAPPAEEWAELVGQPAERGDTLVDELAAIIQRR